VCKGPVEKTYKKNRTGGGRTIHSLFTVLEEDREMEEGLNYPFEHREPRKRGGSRGDEKKAGGTTSQTGTCSCRVAGSSGKRPT